jgi:hypothetical protein
MVDLSVQRLSNVEAEMLQRGYYEDLISINRFNTELWDLYSKRPSNWPRIQDTGAAQLTGDFLALELMPDQQINFHGATFSTNSWGMRDQEYALAPAPGTYRIVLLGPSFVMGSGAADNEVFEWLLEDRLNGLSAGGSYDRYEILNMGVAGYSALQELHALESKGLPFKPAAIFYVAHQLEETIVVRNLATQLAGEVEMPYEYLRQLGEEAGIVPGMSQVEAEQRLQPYGRELLIWTYERMGMLARENDAEFVWIFIPAIETTYERELVSTLTQLARDADFTVLDLSAVYNGQEEATIIVAEWDKHPNARGHRLIAEHLYRALGDEGAIPFPAQVDETSP